MEIVESQFLSLGVERDLDDAKLILDEFKRAKAFKGKAQFGALMTRANKSLVTFWETPRLTYPKYTHNKPHSILWSKDSRDLYFSTEKLDGKLVLEHIYPTDLKAKTLLELIDDKVSTPEDMLKWIQENYSGVVLTIITKSEDKLLEGEWKAKATSDGDIWGRYKAAKLNTNEFLALNEDIRYESQSSMRAINNGRKISLLKLAAL